MNQDSLQFFADSRSAHAAEISTTESQRARSSWRGYVTTVVFPLWPAAVFRPSSCPCFTAGWLAVLLAGCWLVGLLVGWLPAWLVCWLVAACLFAGCVVGLFSLFSMFGSHCRSALALYCWMVAWCIVFAYFFKRCVKTIKK